MSSASRPKCCCAKAMGVEKCSWELGQWLWSAGMEGLGIELPGIKPIRSFEELVAILNAFGVNICLWYGCTSGCYGGEGVTFGGMD